MFLQLPDTLPLFKAAVSDDKSSVHAGSADAKRATPGEAPFRNSLLDIPGSFCFLREIMERRDERGEKRRGEELYPLSFSFDSFLSVYSFLFLSWLYREAAN